MVRAGMEGRRYLHIEGHMTAMKMHINLYRYRDEPVVIDDEDTFHADPRKVNQMKSLCNTEPVKTINWGTTSRLLDDHDIPESFQTISKVMVITNHVTVASPSTAALFDRGTVLSFEPAASEVHAQVTRWLDDGEILSFFERWLRIIPSPSMRLYTKAREMKAAGIDWRHNLMQLFRAAKLWLVDELQNDPALNSEEERATAFATRRGGSRATYYRHLKRWRKAVGDWTDARRS